MYGFREVSEKKRRRYMAYTDDGIMDVVLGAGLLAAVGFITYDLIPIGAVWIVLLMPVMWALKTWITVPRLDLSELPDDIVVKSRQVKILTLLVGFLALVAGILVIGTTFSSAIAAEFFRYFVSSAVIVMILSLLLVVGYLNQTRRWYGYAAAGALFAIMGSNVGLTLPASLLLMGGLITLSGLVVMVNFILSNPVQADEKWPE